MRRFSPQEFEKYVARYLRHMARIDGWNRHVFEVRHREIVGHAEDRFEMDVTVRFRTLGVDFLLLIECKHLARKVEREAVLVLNDKKEAVGAQKGVIFSTSGFQSGAIRYAGKRGIALIDCSHRSKEPVTIIGAEFVPMLHMNTSPPPIEPSCTDWTVHWKGQRFCAEHWFAARLLFRDSSALEPLPQFWPPTALG